MTEPGEGRSILERAQRMQAEVRRLDASAGAEQAARSTAQRVGELETALGDLAAHVRVGQALAAHASVEVALDDVRDGLAELQRHAAVGLPKDRVVSAARRKVDATAERVADRNQRAWHEWTTAAHAQIPANRLAGLDREHQATARRLIVELGRLRDRPKPTVTDIAEFSAKHAAVLEELAAAADASDELLELLSRLDARTTTLRDLTDADIALLREHGMDNEVEVRRKPR